MPALLAGLPSDVLALAYLVAAVLFVLGLRDLTSPRTAPRGNVVSAAGMALAVAVTLLWFEILSPFVLLAALAVGTAGGAWLARTVETTEMPELVGLFNGFGGGASVLVAGAELVDRAAASGPVSYGTPFSLDVATAAALTGFVGAVTFAGSLFAAAKLHGYADDPVHYAGEQAVKLAALALAVAVGVVLVVSPALLTPGGTSEWVPAYWLLALAAAALGVLVVASIGGADMPVVISLLNALSGLAAATTGFVLDNAVLIVAGALVGASGLVLTNVMCASMNRELADVLFGRFGGTATGDHSDYEGVKATSPEEVAMLLDAAERVVVVPGYGMAVGQAQHAVATLAADLVNAGVDVAFGVHPVAGRMPGHMNVLLAEANVPYERLRELDEVNPTFSRTDVVLVVGANDVVNPAAEDPDSPIAGMPVLRVWDAGTVIVNKRSLAPGYAGIKNPLFEQPNTYMLYGDAREQFQAVVTEYEKNHRR